MNSDKAGVLVLILFSLTACIGVMLKVLEVKDWMMIAGMVFSFFFTNALPSSPARRTDDTTKNALTPPDAGKQ